MMHFPIGVAGFSHLLRYQDRGPVGGRAQRDSLESTQFAVREVVVLA